jgi:3',5'-cyclic AMP phosphodiesterase CpdA
LIELAHISDLHFGRTNNQVVKALKSKLQLIQPDCVIISGDLTQRAKTKQYIESGMFLDELPVPYLIVPGNHDVSATRILERFFYPWRKWCNTLPVRLESNLVVKQTVIVGINTVKLFDLSLDWSRGRISASQLKNIQTNFSGYDPAHLRILVGHHPFWLPERFAKRNVIYGRDRALEQFSELGPDLILSGHIHVPFVRVLKGIIISHAGTACSTRYVEEKPNSFNVIRGDNAQIMIQSYSWNETDFVPQEPFIIKSMTTDTESCYNRQWGFN